LVALLGETTRPYEVKIPEKLPLDTRNTVVSEVANSFTTFDWFKVKYLSRQPVWFVENCG
jgi:hypothetical protein